MTKAVNPRLWNLFVGASLACGCGTQATGDDTSTTTAQSGTESGETDSSTSTATSDDSETDSGPDSETDSGPESGPDDGYSDPECVDNEDCDDFEICEYEPHFGSSCNMIATPPPLCGPGDAGIPTLLDPGAPPLGLSFTDLDDDGQDELVVATETELLVYELGADTPTPSPREQPSALIRDMTSGHFDQLPGEDVILLVDADHHLYSSDGVAALGSVSISPAPNNHNGGLIAADLDGQDPTDLVVWGGSGASIVVDGQAVEFVPTPIFDAVVLDLGTPAPGIMLAPSNELRLFDLSGNLLESQDQSDEGLMALVSNGQAYYLTANFGWERWTELRVHETNPLMVTGRINHYDLLSHFESGDVDGDGQSDMVAFGPEGITLWTDPLDAGCLRVLELGVDSEPYGLAFGDHDGDGDDEIALRFATGEVVILDGE